MILKSKLNLEEHTEFYNVFLFYEENIYNQIFLKS